LTLPDLTARQAGFSLGTCHAMAWLNPKLQDTAPRSPLSEPFFARKNKFGLFEYVVWKVVWGMGNEWWAKVGNFIKWRDFLETLIGWRRLLRDGGDEWSRIVRL